MPVASCSHSNNIRFVNVTLNSGILHIDYMSNFKVVLIGGGVRYLITNIASKISWKYFFQFFFTFPLIQGSPTNLSLITIAMVRKVSL